MDAEPPPPKEEIMTARFTSDVEQILGQACWATVHLHQRPCNFRFWGNLSNSGGGTKKVRADHV